MTFLHAWGLLGLLAVPVLVLLSLWRWRRREAPVSSLLLWQRVAAEQRAPTTRRRRGMAPLLLLRLAIALVLTAAAADLILPTGASMGRHIVLIVDRSASMATSWSACRTALDEVLDALDSTDAVDVLVLPAMEAAARGLTPAAARQHLDSLEPSDQAVPTDDLVRAAHLQPQDATIVVVTDQSLDGLPMGASLLARPGADVNRGIVAFAARRRTDGSHRVLATVAGGEGDVALLLSVDGQAPTRTAVSIPPKGRATAFFDVPADATLLAIRLDGSDSLTADDAAWLARSAAPTRIALVGPSCPALARALAAPGGTDVTEMAVPPRRAVPEGFDLAVYYRAVPARLDGGRVVLVAPRRAVGQLRPTAPAPASDPPTAGRDPLLDGVDLSGIDLGPLPHPTVFPSFDPVVRAGDAVVIGRWSEANSRIVYVGADPSLGDWALHPSFPIFWANVVAATTGGRGDFASARPGDAVRLPGVPDSATVRTPSGEHFGGAEGVFRPGRIGVYEIVSDGQTENRVAVSLLSESETVSSGYDHPLPPDWLDSATYMVAMGGFTTTAPWLLVAAALLVIVHERLMWRGAATGSGG